MSFADPSRRALSVRTPWLLCLALLGVANVQAHGLPQRHLYPVGGGYETALRGFATEVIKQARGPAVNITVLPAAFADDPVLPEDPGILAEDVQLIQEACDAVVDKVAFPAGCLVDSQPLYVAADAHNPAIVNALNSAVLDGVFFTGGDQGYAMRILARTPAEAALSVGAQRGLVVGGTSAGAAIQSLVMNAGYTEPGDSTNALQRGSIDLWFGQPDGQRGLVFGSRHLVIDEHVYSRGRLGRMLNASAQTVDRLGQGGLLGLGFDYDTGGAITGDRWLGQVAGVSSGVVVDFRTAGARHRWRGPNTALSARRILTHLLPPGKGIGFDLWARTPRLSGRPLPWRGDRLDPGHTLRSRHAAALILGGDVSEDLGGPVIKAAVRLASARQRVGGQFLVVAAGHATPADAQASASLYAQALVDAGWRGTTRTIVHGQAPLDAGALKGVAGVLLLGGDQSLLDTALNDAGFRAFVDQASRRAGVLMLDRAMTAAAGEHFDAIGEGATADDAIFAFTTRNAVLKPGLGLVRGAAFEPRLQIDKRWGRLYGIGARQPQLGVYGISESTAIVLAGRQALVIGQNPVVTLDARRATFVDGDNGALGAFNVLLDVHEPFEDLNR